MTNAKRFEEICEKFREMFPNVEATMKPFMKDVVIVTLKNGKTRLFLYKGDDDWMFGTKLYRARPKQVSHKITESKKEEQTNGELSN